MSDPIGVTEWSWVQTGGVALFASAVLYQLRDLKPLLASFRDEWKAFREELHEMRLVVDRLVRRDDLRQMLRQERGRRREPSDAPPDECAPVELHGEVTDQVEVAIPLRTPARSGKTPAKGVPSQPYSHHHKRGPTHGG